MSKSNFNEESSSLDLPPEFEEYLNFEAKIPHKLTLVKSNSDKNNEKNPDINPDKNNFINSTLYCLTNLKYFLEYLYKCQDLDSASFKILKQVVTSIYDNINNGKKEFNSDFFTKFILGKIKLFENKLYHNPRILIDCVLNKFFLVNNSYNSSISNPELSDSNAKSIFFLNQYNIDNTNTNSDINFSVKESYGIEQNTYIEDKISIVIKKTRKCPNINCGETETIYKNMTTLHFNLKDINKEYSLYDCFDEFLKKENDKNGKCSKCSKENKCIGNSLFYKFPESIIILIYYGEEKNNDEFKHFNYNFEEIIDFSNLYNKFVDDQLKNKKYFLSSLIACKFPKIEKNPDKDEGELFYTFCRGNKDPKFVVYNNEFILENRIVNKQIKKLKTEAVDPKKSYPFVLIYTSIKD
jgi:hypothetical protein